MVQDSTSPKRSTESAQQKRRVESDWFVEWLYGGGTWTAQWEWSSPRLKRHVQCACTVRAEHVQCANNCTWRCIESARTSRIFFTSTWSVSTLLVRNTLRTSLPLLSVEARRSRGLRRRSQLPGSLPPHRPHFHQSVLATNSFKHTMSALLCYTANLYKFPTHAQCMYCTHHIFCNWKVASAIMLSAFGTLISCFQSVLKINSQVVTN